MESNGSKDIAKRYTDESYASKDEVRRSLNTTLVDPFWNAILSYRSQYSKPIHLYTVGSLPYAICYTPAIIEKSNDIGNRLAKCLTTYIGLDEGEKTAVKFMSAEQSLMYIGEYYAESFTRDFVDTVINGGASNLQGISLAKKKAVNFYNAYKTLGDHRVNVDADFLVNLYIALSRRDNLVSIYRNFNFDTNNASVINREYNGVPFTRIELLMNQLYTFLLDSKLSAFIKASAAYYYINYVKPFDGYNNEIAILVFKAIIGNDDKEAVGYLLPFEEMLKHEETFMNDFKEVNRGNDLTYVIMRIANYAIGVIETFLDNCTNTKISDLRHEHAPEPDKNTPDNKKSEETSKTSEKEDNPVKETVGTVAIPTIESGLEEKDAHKFEKYLLEKNPRLKASQAHFYARHCTMGSYYTIQMFKKAEKVVYETARTSMETLTEFGYYKKEQIKNKFVYTPVKLEEK